MMKMPLSMQIQLAFFQLQSIKTPSLQLIALQIRSEFCRFTKNLTILMIKSQSK